MSNLLPSIELVILFTLFMPLVGAVFSVATKNKKLREICLLVVSGALFINMINLFSLGAKGALPPVVITDIMPGLSLTFFIDPLGILFGLVASFLWIVTTVYSVGYMDGNKEAHQPRFFAFFAISIFAAIGIAFAGNLLTLFLFYEILTLCTFPLVTHHGTLEAKKSGRTYLGILLGGSIVFFLPAMIWTYHLAGTLDFDVGGILNGKITPLSAGFLLLLFTFGVGKCAVMPLHRWLPAAMVAPTPVSALLHAVAVVKAGVFTFVKIIIYIFGAENLRGLIDQNWFAGGWLVYLAGTTILLASIVALRQDNLKKMLAYSTISQLSYVIMAAAILAPKSLIAAGFHIAAHAVGKITLFFAAGSIYTASHKKNISQLDGIGKRMPYTMAAFTIGAISMIGLPPAVGFLSKYYMLVGAFENGQFFAISVIILSTLLNAAYFLPIIFKAFFGVEKRPKNFKPHGEAPTRIVIALSITSALTLGLFLFPDIFLWLSLQPVVAR